MKRYFSHLFIKKISFNALKNFLEPNDVEPKSPIYPALQPHSLEQVRKDVS